MKKEILQISFQLLFALAAVSSCQRFDEPISAVPGEFRATTEQPSTKTSLGEDWSVLWQDSDSIAVFEGNTALSCYKVTKGAGTPSAIFSVVSSSTHGSPLQSNVAVYPYDDNMTISTDGTVMLTIPSAQKYKDGGFASGTNLMVASTPDVEGKSFAFKNVLSIVRVNLTGSDVIRTLEFSGNNNEPVCGKATIKPVFGEEPALSFSSGAGTKLTLDCGEGVQLSSSEPTCFYLEVPAMEYLKGFKVVATAANGKSMTMTVSEKTVLKRSKVKTASATGFKGEFNDGFVHLESPELEAYCIEEFDLDGDGRLSEKEASKVTSINLDYIGIDVTSLNGIEYFVNLQELKIQGGYYMFDERDNISYWIERGQMISGTVDLSKNTKLRVISFRLNQVNDLILPKTQTVSYIDLYGSIKLRSIDLSQYPNLYSLDLGGSELSSLDVSANPELEFLCVSASQLTEIDLSCNRKLRTLDLTSNRLTNIDLSVNTKLSDVALSFNNLSYLDVSKLPDLRYLGCGNNSNLKYLVISREQNINNIYPVRGDSWYIPETTEIVFDDEFRITPQNCEADPGGDIVEIEVLSLNGSHISSVPDWVKLLGNETDGILNRFSFLVDANTSGAERSAQIVICDDGGKCHSAAITQKKQEEHEEQDWRETDFYHRSLIMRFTGTWCGYCPWMAEAIEIAKDEHPEKIEAISMHDSGSTLYFNGVDLMIQRFGISAFPTGVVDCRREVNNEAISTTAKNLFQAVQETENNYKAVTGISFSSAINGNTLDVDVSVYAKAAEEFKIAVVLLEDGIVADQAGADPGYIHYDVPRLNLSSSMEGDSFTVSQANSVVPLHFSGIIPDKCVKKNCRVLVYIQRKYGSQKIVRTSGYGDWYVDNCVSGRAGGSVSLALGSDGSSHLGGNEDITPGDDIDF